MGEQGVQLLVGTTKGAFVLDGDAERSAWSVRGPYCDGWPINHVVGDPTTGTMWAGGGGEFSGAGVWRSGDGGRTWSLTQLTSGQMDEWAANDPEFAAQIGWSETPKPFGDRFGQVWSLGRAGDRLYAGTKPALLLVSDDDGATWSEVKGLSDHPSRPDWGPGAAGLVLHTILCGPTEPERLWIGISSAGVLSSSDGGVSWERRNDLADPSAYGPDGHPDLPGHPAGPRDGQVGLCVHHIERAPGDGDVLYQQNHCGTWRSGDGGATWQAQRSGLPQESCFFTVLRQAMTGDTRTPAGVYFGTNTGSLFASTDEGDTWHEVARHLPTVLSVEVLER